MLASAQSLIDLLHLAPHPEGGFFRETFRAPLTLAGLPHGGRRSASTAIYFLLPAGAFSAFHRVRADEAWHFYDGDPLELHTLLADGTHRVELLGRDWDAGQRPQTVVPAGVWQAAAPRGEGFSLVGCTVAPGFDFADFEMPPRAELLAALPDHAEVIRRFSRA